MRMQRKIYKDFYERLQIEWRIERREGMIRERVYMFSMYGKSYSALEMEGQIRISIIKGKTQILINSILRQDDNNGVFVLERIEWEKL